METYGKFELYRKLLTTMAQLDGPPGYGGFRPDSMHPLSNSIGMGMAGGPLRPGPADPGSIGMPLYDATKH